MKSSDDGQATIMIPSFWPHVWAIPLVLLFGFIAGWAARSATTPGRPGDGSGATDSDSAPDARLFED